MTRKTSLLAAKVICNKHKGGLKDKTSEALVSGMGVGWGAQGRFGYLDFEI